MLAKYFERWAEKYKGRRCLDLSAGCGLVGALPIDMGLIIDMSFATHGDQRHQVLMIGLWLQRSASRKLVDKAISQTIQSYRTFSDIAAGLTSSLAFRFMQSLCYFK